MRTLHKEVRGLKGSKRAQEYACAHLCLVDMLLCYVGLRRSGCQERACKHGAALATQQRQQRQGPAATDVAPQPGGRAATTAVPAAVAAANTNLVEHAAPCRGFICSCSVGGMPSSHRHGGRLCLKCGALQWGSCRWAATTHLPVHVFGGKATLGHEHAGAAAAYQLPARSIVLIEVPDRLSHRSLCAQIFG